MKPLMVNKGGDLQMQDLKVTFAIIRSDSLFSSFTIFPSSVIFLYFLKRAVKYMLVVDHTLRYPPARYPSARGG